jgi:hypothetical protein
VEAAGMELLAPVAASKDPEQASKQNKFKQS